MSDSTPEAQGGRSRRAGLLAGLLGNSALRALTIGAKSVLIFALAIWLEPEELGHYGLVAAIVSLTNYLYGLDFHWFFLRDISIADRGDLRRKLRDQFLFYAVLYGVATAILWWLVPVLGLDRGLVPLVILVTILQHYTLELYRILVRLERVLPASVVFFVRDAGWIPFCLLQWWLVGALDLRAILGYWLFGSVASVAVAAWCLASQLPPGPVGAIDFEWLRTGVVTGLRMLPGTLSLRSLFSVDRMLLALLVAPDVLGAYVFYIGLCMAFHGLFESGILPYYWPALLESEKTGDGEALARARRELYRICWLVPTGVALAAGTAGLVAAHLLSNPVYSENLDLLAFLAVAYGVLGASNAPNFVLFAKKKDSQIVLSQVVTLGVLVVVALLVGWFQPRIAVPTGLLVAAVAMLGIKTLMVRRVDAQTLPTGAPAAG